MKGVYEFCHLGRRLQFFSYFEYWQNPFQSDSHSCHNLLLSYGLPDVGRAGFSFVLIFLLCHNAAGCRRLYRNLGGLIFFVYKMCHYAFAHCAAADVAVADEKYFYHVAKTSVNA